MKLTLLTLLLLLNGCGAHVYHQIKKGETLYSVSWQYGQDFHQVAKWNRIKSPYLLRPGDWIRVAPPVVGTKTQSVKRRAVILDRFADSASSSVAPAPAKKSPTKVTTKTPGADPQKWLWPVKGELLRKFDAKAQGRKGIEIAGQLGAAISATAAGRVVYSGNGLRGYGNLIIVKHSDRFLSAYAHNRALLVKEGVKVKQGQTIAKMGRTESERINLYFEIRLNGKAVDPLRYLP